MTATIATRALHIKGAGKQPLFRKVDSVGSGG